MIKTAQDAYLAGRQAAMEKLAYDIPEATPFGRNRLPLNLPAGALANFLGARAAEADGIENARMSLRGIIAPTSYAALGRLGGYGLGQTLGHLSDEEEKKKILEYLPTALGELGGLGYGLHSAYKRPSTTRDYDIDL